MYGRLLGPDGLFRVRICAQLADPGRDCPPAAGSLANSLLSTSESCTTEIARRLDAHCITFNAPAVVSSAALATALRAEPIIRDQLEGIRSCNKSVFSLSPCTPDTHVVQFKIATVEEVEDYRRRGAVGIIAGASSMPTGRLCWANSTNA